MLMRADTLSKETVGHSHNILHANFDKESNNNNE